MLVSLEGKSGQQEVKLVSVIKFFMWMLYVMYDEISQIGGWMRQRGGGSFEQIKGLNSGEIPTNLLHP